MRNFLSLILIILFTSMVLGIETINNEKEEGTRVVFYIENQIQQPEDYVEISIEIKSQHPSLERAINEAGRIVTQVESIVKNYCESHSKNKKDCEKVVETSEYKIDPIYQLVRKIPTFVGKTFQLYQAFSVSHETVAKILDVSGIGKLADDILKSGVSKIRSFEWKPLEEIDNEEQAVSEGMELVNNICDQIGLELGRIVAVSEVTDYEDDQQGQPQKDEDQQQEEEKQEQQQEEQEPTVVYRFEIICEQKIQPSKN